MSEIKSVEVAIIDGELFITRKVNGVAVEVENPRSWCRESRLSEALERHLGMDFRYLNGDDSE